jgi:O-antigen/teichoic acid export membrane protein
MVQSLGVRVAHVGLHFGVSVVLARTLGAEGYGVYAYAMVWVGFLSIPTQFGLPSLLVREAASYVEQERWALLRGLLRRSDAIALGIAVGVVLVGGGVLWSLGDRLSDVQRTTGALALVLLPFVALGSLRGAALRGLGSVIAGQLPDSVLRPVLFVALLGAVVWSAGTGALAPDRAMGLHAVAAAGGFLAGSLMLRRRLPTPARHAAPAYRMQAWLSSMLPLALLGGMHAVNQQAGILLLGLFESVADVGVYRIAVQASVFLSFVLMSVNMVLAPRFSRLHVAGEHDELQRTVTWGARVALAASLPLVVVFIAFGDVLLAFVYGEAFAAGYLPLVVLCLGQSVNVVAGSVGLLLNMTGHERDTTLGFGAAAVANVALNLALIPLYGKLGAAVATSLSLVVWNVFLCVRAHARLGIVPTAWGARSAPSLSSSP